MIGKTVIGRGFKGCVNYLLSKVEKGDGEILEARGVRDFDKKQLSETLSLVPRQILTLPGASGTRHSPSRISSQRSRCTGSEKNG